MFHVVGLDDGFISREIFPTGKEAAVHAQKLSIANGGNRYKPKRVPISDRSLADRIFTLSKNFENKKHNGWVGYYIIKQYFQTPKWLLPHTVIGEPMDGSLYHFATPEAMMAGIKTRSTPGRMLTKYATDLQYIPEQGSKEQRIKNLTEKLLGYLMPMDVQYTNDPDEIEHVYRAFDGFSCAKFTKWDSSKQGPHPARCMSSPDTTLAYVMKDNTNIARSWIRNSNKTMTPAMGGAKTQLSTHLQSLGHTVKDNFGGNDFEGVRMSRIIFNDRYVACHMDYWPRLYDDGEYLIAHPKGNIRCTGAWSTAKVWKDNDDEFNPPELIASKYVKPKGL